MRILILIISMLFSISTLAQTKILLLGDSLSAAYGIDPANSWVKIINDKLKTCSSAVELINASISGDRTENALARLPDLLKAYHPDIVWVEMGSNDALRGAKIQDISKHLNEIIKLSQASGAKVILFELKMPPNFGEIYTTQFNQIFHDASKKFKIVLIPFLLQAVSDQTKYIQPDNLHPTDLAQPIIAQTVWPSVAKAIGCTIS